MESYEVTHFSNDLIYGMYSKLFPSKKEAENYIQKIVPYKESDSVTLRKIEEVAEFKTVKTNSGLKLLNKNSKAGKVLYDKGSVRRRRA